MLEIALRCYYCGRENIIFKIFSIILFVMIKSIKKKTFKIFLNYNNNLFSSK